MVRSVLIFSSLKPLITVGSMSHSRRMLMAKQSSCLSVSRSGLQRSE